MLAVAYGCDLDLVDFILANGVPPLETDTENGSVNLLPRVNWLTYEDL